MTARARDMSADVLVIGGGPAGLTAAAALAARVAGSTVVLEREAAAGGIPRHSDHLGYGIRDLRRFLSGPAYARRLVTAAERGGADLRTRTMVTGWADERTAEVTSPEGRWHVSARAIILATGARERPRSARLVAGDRPGGVLTTGQLQNVVHLQHRSPGRRAVIVGSELVSWSAAMTLRHAGCRTVLMTTLHPRPEAYAAFSIPGRLALRIPIATRTRVSRILGHERVAAVEIEDLGSGQRRIVECDTVVFTGDWIPDNELARAAGLEVDRATKGPVIDTAQTTSRAGIFAIGNLAHPVDTADVAALDGRAVAEHVRRYLDGTDTPITTAAPRIKPGRLLRWISPGIWRPDAAPPRERLLAWPEEHVTAPTVTVTQNDHILARRRLPWPASPGRVFRIPSSLLAGTSSDAGPVTVAIA